jgi:hypothetical protein
MNLVTINRDVAEIPAQQRPIHKVQIENHTIESLTAKIEEIKEKAKEDGFTIFRTEFLCDIKPVCWVIASRLETPEETQARITKQQQRNAREMHEHAAKLERIARQKEIDRLLGGYTLDQLQAMTKPEL